MVEKDCGDFKLEGGGGCSMLGVGSHVKKVNTTSYRRASPDGLQYKHIMMLPVGVLYPNGVIQFQQDHSSIHNSHVVQEWLSRQANVKLVDWPTRAPDTNPSRICGLSEENHARNLA
jgi:hypothetical protein